MSQWSEVVRRSAQCSTVSSLKPMQKCVIRVNKQGYKEPTRCVIKHVGPVAHLGLLKGPTLFAYRMTSSPGLKVCEAASPLQVLNESSTQETRRQRPSNMFGCGRPGAQFPQCKACLPRMLCQPLVQVSRILHTPQGSLMLCGAPEAGASRARPSADDSCCSTGSPMLE